jgi:hypothetical protein
VKDNFDLLRQRLLKIPRWSIGRLLDSALPPASIASYCATSRPLERFAGIAVSGEATMLHIHNSSVTVEPIIPGAGIIRVIDSALLSKFYPLRQEMRLPGLERQPSGTATILHCCMIEHPRQPGPNSEL